MSTFITHVSLSSVDLASALCLIPFLCMRHSNVSDWFVVENLRRNTVSHLLPLVLRFAWDERLLCVSRDLSF